MAEVHVFGVVRAADGAPPGARTIAHKDVAAIVTEAEHKPIAASKLLREHSRLLEATAEQTTVLPVRFGTVMQDEQAVIDEFLAPSHDALRQRLDALDGKVQLTVKGFYDEGALLREVIDASPAIAKLRERVRRLPEAAGYYDRIRLGELVSAEVEQARERDTTAVLGRLEPLAVAASREPPSTLDSAVHAAFLVERDRVDDFSRAVAQLGDELAGRMKLRYIGPLPAYSFTGDDAPTGAAAWA
jgi:hypothetical protein